MPGQRHQYHLAGSRGREGLPGIPTNVLSTRLKALEDAAVVERRLLPPPDRAVVYALTDNGRTMNDAVLGLARWGATRLGDPRPGEVVTADSLVMALRTTFHPDAAADVTATWERHVGDTVLHAIVDHGTVLVPSGVVAMNLRLSDDEAAALRRKADDEGCSMQEVARTAIRQYTTDRQSRLSAAIERIRTEDAELLDRLAK